MNSIHTATQTREVTQVTQSNARKQLLDTRKKKAPSLGNAGGQARTGTRLSRYIKPFRGNVFSNIIAHNKPLKKKKISGYHTEKTDKLAESLKHRRDGTG